MTFWVMLTTVSNRSFLVVGPWTCSDLLDDVISVKSLFTFQQQFKILLFLKSFFDHFLD